jgi:hypothetical protein
LSRDFKGWVIKMIIGKYSKIAALALGLAAPLGVSSAHAAANCGSAADGTARITSVMQDMPGFDNITHSTILGIEVSYDIKTTKDYYYTYGLMDLDGYPKARSLLQLADLAYATRSPVIITVDSTCTVSDTLDGKPWVRLLRGITLGSLAKR